MKKIIEISFRVEVELFGEGKNTYKRNLQEAIRVAKKDALGSSTMGGYFINRPLKDTVRAKMIR